MDRSAARRIALAAQGFTDPRPAKVTARQFARALDRMQILQLDSVNVITRSHFLPMLARLGPYEPDHLDRWLWRSGRNMEFLAHEASITSAALRPLLAHRFDRLTWRKAVQLRKDQPGYIESVLAEIEAHGPLSVSDLADPGKRHGPWWGNPKGKTALVCLYNSGSITVANRTKNFLTQYDLPERVLPQHVLDEPVHSKEDAERELLMLGARAHGVGTATDIADYFRIKMPAARPLLKELVADGRLIKTEVEGWGQPAYFHPDARRPRRVEARALLSPFDPVVWFRPRAERLFDFHYRIEIYTPEPKRIYGYYVLPFLLDEEIVGRVDLKADRNASVLIAKGTYAEPGHDHDRIAPPLAESLRELAGFLDLDSVEVAPRGDLAATLNAVL
ncbi:MAG: winged helix-turn-helix domain-containing protein [Acidimicrobiales bacterium]|nr:winged helix-turn-helix domain-containing protein [Acidimicrobiales bacterium]